MFLKVYHSACFFTQRETAHRWESGHSLVTVTISDKHLVRHLIVGCKHANLIYIRAINVRQLYHCLSRCWREGVWRLLRSGRILAISNCSLTYDVQSWTNDNNSDSLSLFVKYREQQYPLQRFSIDQWNYCKSSIYDGLKITIKRMLLSFSFPSLPLSSLFFLTILYRN
jgi:hypothetical protein